jgi:lipopolysaccharide/colanic/teichoic acid biosynthesis glycosyltransferase
MEQYIILIAGPLQSRNKAFADELSRLLGTEQPVSCRALEETLDEPSTEVFLAAASGHYRIIYGPHVLENEILRRASDFRLYVECSDLDLAAEMIRVYMESGEILETEGGAKPAAGTGVQARKLSDAIESITRDQAKDKDARKQAETAAYATSVALQDEMPNEAIVGVYQYIRRTDPALARLRVSEEERRKRINAMIKQYEGSGGRFSKAKIKRKLWLAFIKTTLFFKRILDIAAALVALLLLLPLFTAVALAIKLTDGGPILYVQTRIGKYGKPFPFPKFRSMVLNADSMKDELLKQAERVGDVTFKMKRDPRVTRIGRFIRRFSIDELPQLWCVLKGDMSLVGPRPPVPREVALYTQEDRRRLEVTPGLTGIWQVSGRADIEFKQQVELDVLYIESHGFWLDILLILKTIPAVFSGKGAY